MMMSETGEQMADRMNEMVHEYKGSSSSDSDNEDLSFHDSRKKYLFGRKKPVHAVLGGGKCMFHSTILHLFPFSIS